MTIQPNPKKCEFSKVILGVASLTNILVMIFACVMIWRTQDLSPLPCLIASVAAEVATGRAFYYNKAKTENIIKLQNIYKDLPILKSMMPEVKVDKKEEPVG